MLGGLLYKKYLGNWLLSLSRLERRGPGSLRALIPGDSRPKSLSPGCLAGAWLWLGVGFPSYELAGGSLWGPWSLAASCCWGVSLAVDLPGCWAACCWLEGYVSFLAVWLGPFNCLLAGTVLLLVLQ
jgi:hypothetical protein